ncbi:hypothetical protein BZA05DRAFT_22758 [Tricharina praecox]|uniref:uncharacterized protein n=1 Tax=Tricharina praecox TaxID=43433 RepID=UPI002220916B|nr:uncharacterized protein BZA05DRAFT_22758 [Tricharina praecox]KAI5859156.1 hypothetical protein BZA05DRAFT_22758 [Tricharina praecox]
MPWPRGFVFFFPTYFSKYLFCFFGWLAFSAFSSQPAPHICLQGCSSFFSFFLSLSFSFSVSFFLFPFSFFIVYGIRVIQFFPFTSGYSTLFALNTYHRGFEGIMTLSCSSSVTFGGFGPDKINKKPLPFPHQDKKVTCMYETFSYA